ncbi:hypothetical protein Rhopal_007040-T1 [Rhodotorula paludigena]|uniref:Luciferase domain-containing protein n=1 Tax=Rhodotorula paludigena TaxID=86838 RepID=A0AAV5GWW6_9BASI|nr:hypothetical protein Rhopal_007040-T1 [Rhodotorula paludigena]
MAASCCIGGVPTDPMHEHPFPSFPAPHSLHCTVSPRDAALVLSRGWGVLFPVSRWRRTWLFRKLGYARWTMPEGYILVYAPRDKDELEVVEKIVRASVTWMTGLNDAM